MDTTVNSQFIKILPPLVDGFAANILAYATLLAAVSTIVMALLELAKGILGLRLLYQKWMVRKWIAKNSLENDAAYNQLVILSVSDLKSDKALFNQASDKMMGEIQAASNVALDFPNIYPDIYFFLTKISAIPTIKNSQIDSPKSDAILWKQFSANLDSKTALAGTANPELQAATQARARLDHFVTRKLDAFQTRIDYIWARLNQIVAITGSSIFIYILLKHIILNITCFQGVLYAIFGGMIAPFAKDVVTALTGLRAGK